MTAPPAQPPDDLAARVVSIKAGDFLYRQGDEGGEMYVVQQGSVELLKTREGLPEPRQVQVLEVGDVLGELSLLTALPREMSARAVTPCQVLRLDEAALRQLVTEDAEIAVRLLRQLARKHQERLEAEEHALVAAARAAAGARRAGSGAGASGRAADGSRSAGMPAARPRPAGGGVPTLVHHASGTRLALPKKAEISVGRPDKHAGSAPDIDLSPFDNERTLSRQHARFVVKGEDVFVREEASARNGTFVNGCRVQADTEVPLTDGDRVRFGAVDTVFRFL